MTERTLFSMTAEATLKAQSALAGEFCTRPATLEDVEAAVAMFNRASRAVMGADEFTAARYRREWQTPGFDLERDTRLVLTPEGRIVGCGEVWASAPYVQLWGWSRVDPDFTGRGIGSYLLGWAEARCRELIPQAPAGARVATLRGAASSDGKARALFEANGYAAVRHSWQMRIHMEAAPPAPQWPPGIRPRLFAPGQDDEAVFRVVVEAFRDHWGAVERPFEEGLARFRHSLLQRPTFDPSLCFLAVEEGSGAIAGVSLCLPHIDEDPAMGWVEILGVRRPWRRRGLGLALLRHSFGAFYRRGVDRVGLGVDAGSLTGATRLYEKAGMRVHRQMDLYEKVLRAGRELSTRSLEG